MTKNDGGAAFPRSAAHGGAREGMSLRDWFAGQALAGIMASGDFALHVTRAGAARGLTAEDSLAIGAYETADAMLAARSRT